MHKYFQYIFISIILQACANQTAPTGGPKDEEAPILIQTIPQNGTVNFKDQEIILEFNEYLKANKPQSEIIISPRPKGNFDLKIKKERAILTFEEPLQDSTTYTINFRESIQDITEGNTPEQLSLAFSTGSYLDSLSISGNVTYLNTQEVANDISLLLYDADDTLNVYQDKPLYFTKTNEEGLYQFQNLKPGRYLLYSVKDENNNLVLDLKSEDYGFQSDTLLISDSITTLNFNLLHLDARDLEIKSTRQNGLIYEIKANKFITSYTLENLTDSSKLYSTFTEDHTGIELYNTLDSDSISLKYMITDSLNNTYTDTLNISFEESERKGKDYEIKSSISKVFTSTGQLKGTIAANKPIKNLTPDSILLLIDSTNIFQLKLNEHLTPNFNYTQFDINYTIPQILFNPKTEVNTSQSSAIENTLATTSSQPIKPHLYLGYGAFISIDQDSSNRISSDLSFLKPESLGILHFTLQTDHTNYIIQLLDKNYNVIREMYDLRDVTFSNLLPGDYLLRVIHDVNANQQWDQGNINTMTQPEPVYFYSNDEGEKLITIRANWEVGPLSMLF